MPGRGAEITGLHLLSKERHVKQTRMQIVVITSAINTTKKPTLLKLWKGLNASEGQQLKHKICSIFRTQTSPASDTAANVLQNLGRTHGSCKLWTTHAHTRVEK